MESNKFKIRLRGNLEDAEHVRLNEFIKQLESVRIALKHTENIVTKSDEASINYLITDLTHSSPATVSIEAIGATDAGINFPSLVVSKFVHSVKTIMRDKKIPVDFDRQALEAYKGISYGLRKHISEFTIIDSESGYETETKVSSEFDYVIDSLIGPDLYSEGSVKGHLEVVNVHDKNSFVIYPDIGPKRIQCNFKKDLFDTVRTALRQHVIVSGMMKFKSMDPFPYELDVEEIEICPSEDSLPTLWDLRGIAQDAFGNEGSVKFVRAIRDAEI